MTAVRLNLVVVGTVVVVTAGFAVGLLIPGLRELDRARAEVTGKVSAVQAQQQQVGNVSELYGTIQEMDRQLADFRTRLPEDRQFGEFLNELSENLKRNQIEEYVVQPRLARFLDESKLPADLALAKGTIVLPVNVSFETSFTRLFDFLKGMQAVPRLHHVESMSVVNDEQQPGLIRVEIELLTYHRPT